MFAKTRKIGGDRADLKNSKTSRFYKFRGGNGKCPAKPVVLTALRQALNECEP